MCEVAVVCDLDIHQGANRPRVLIPAKLGGVRTDDPRKAVMVQRMPADVYIFFPETVRYTFVPKDSLVGFVSIVGTGSTS
jgi:hypothetical protein